jgi:hypothetical protein
VELDIIDALARVAGAWAVRSPGNLRWAPASLCEQYGNSPKARRHSQVHWRIPIQINDSRGPPLFKTKRRLLAGGMERTGYCIAEEGWTTERVGTPDIQVAYGKINILSEDRWYQLIPSVIVISLILNQRVQGSSPCAPTKSKRSFGIRACGNRCREPRPSLSGLYHGRGL